MQTARFPVITATDVLRLFRTQACPKIPDIKVCCLHLYVKGNSLIDGLAVSSLSASIFAECAEHVFSNGHRVSNCIFSLGVPYFLTVLSEKDFKTLLVLNKNDTIPLSQITVRSGWRSTEKYHLDEFLNWSLEVSEAERCFRNPLIQGISARCS